MRPTHVFALIGSVLVACGDGRGEEHRFDAASPPTAIQPDGSVSSGASDAGPDASRTSRVLDRRTPMVVSSAPKYVVVGERYRYRPRANQAISGLEIGAAPQGLQLDEGALDWTPTAMQRGLQRVQLRAATTLGRAQQEFVVLAADPQVRASAEVGPSGGRVFGTDRALSGAGVVVPQGALTATTRIELSTLDAPPPFPNARGAVRAIRLTPEGTTFAAPVQVLLPLPEGAQAASGRVSAYRYDAAGRWNRIPVLAIDADNRLLAAHTGHFSIYAAVESSLDATTVLGTAGPRSNCAGKLAGSMALSTAFSDVQLASLGNLDDSVLPELSRESASLQDLLSAPDFVGSLRAVQVFELVSRSAQKVLERDVIVSTVHASAQGLTLSESDSLGNVRSSAQLSRADLAGVQVARRLQGRAAVAHFGVDPSGDAQLAASLYLLYAPGDASYEPVALDDLGFATVDLPPVAAGAQMMDDDDCDGVANAYQTGTSRAALDISPRGVIAAFADEAVLLRAQPSGWRTAAGTWDVIEGTGARLASVPSVLNGRAFTASVEGRYLVRYRADETSAAVEHIFAVDVLPSLNVNTPPTCQPSSIVANGRVGDAVALTAVATDAETASAALRVEWGIFAPSTQTLEANPAFSGEGLVSALTANAAGTYLIGCRAFDGQLSGGVGTLSLHIQERTKNRAPEVTLIPLEVQVEAGDTVKLRATARDADEDALTFSWRAGSLPLQALTSGGASLVEVATQEAGSLLISVHVTDGKNTTEAVATINVDLPPQSIDADADGYSPTGASKVDCNDNDANVHPMAAERCNQRDDDCDGLVDEDSGCTVVDCTTGYRSNGSGGCEDIDECVTGNGGCDPLVVCTNVAGARMCGSCPTGFRGTGASGCVDVDECLNGPCDSLTACVNTIGGFACTGCPEGYVGTGSSGCSDINECAANRGGCDPLTACTNLPGSITCGPCPAGYSGSGRAGCTDVDECATNNGGCDRLAPCTNTIGGYSCGGCPSGYTGGGASGCVDIDECATSNGGCDARTQCINTPGNRMCGACPSGFGGDGQTGCSDVDECAQPNGPCVGGQNCTNSLGSFRCACPSGFNFDGSKCVDIDECANASCGAGARCTNTVGSFQCGCPSDTFDDNGDGTVCSTPRSLAAHSNTTCALTSTGAMFCWGGGVSSPYPKRVQPDSWDAIALGQYHYCGLRRGELFCWGVNSQGQLGSGGTTTSDTPVRVGSDSSWASVTAGGSTTCALKNDAAFCWGENNSAQTGQPGTKQVVLSPTSVGTEVGWTAIAAGVVTSCGINGGSLICWGFRGTWGGPFNSGPELITVNQEPGWTGLAIGSNHMCGVRQGQLYCGGQNPNGQTGRPGSGQTGVIETFNPVGSQTGWSKVSAGDQHGCGILAGQLHCWGAMGATILFDGPTVMSAERDWVDVASGNKHACGMRGNRVYCWGAGGNEQLGNGTMTDSPTPLPIVPQRPR